DAGYLAALIPEEYGGSGLGVTEASIILEEINRSGGNAGACHSQMYTTATRSGDVYVVRGQKVFISRAEHSDLLLLVVRTTPIEQVKKRSEGLSILLVELRDAVGHGLTI